MFPRRSALLLGAALSSAPAWAEAPQLDLAVRTDVPALVGASLTLETPGRARARLTGGFMPGPYVDLTNAAMTGFDIYSDTVAEIIDRALNRSAVIRLEGGYRPLPKRGLTVSGGYQLLTLGGDTADLSVFGEATDRALLERAQSLSGDLEVGVNNHMLSAEVGYEWLLRKHIVVGTSLGFAATVHTGTRVSPTRDPNGAIEEELMSAATASTEDYLTYVFEEWVHLPMVGVSVDYRFPRRTP